MKKLICVLLLLLTLVCIFASCNEERFVIGSETVDGELILKYSDGSTEALSALTDAEAESILGELNIVSIKTTDDNTLILTLPNDVELVFETVKRQSAGSTLYTDIAMGADKIIRAKNAEGEEITLGTLANIKIDKDSQFILNFTDDTSYTVGTILDSSELAHEWGDWVVLIEPICKDGLRAKKCTECGKTELELLDTEHEYVEYPAQEPTCTAIGWNAYHICTLCEDSNYEEIPALGHDAEWSVERAPTCTQTGLEIFKCTRCQMTLDTKVLDALGHELVDGECIRCHLKNLSLVIHYVYTDGTAASDDYRATLWEGSSYRIVSPEIAGFVADIPVASGMLDANKELTVTYTTIEIQKITRIDPVNLGDVAYNTPFSSLALPSTVTGYTATGRAVALRVYWNDESYDPTAYGSQTVTGAIIAGYGYMLECSNVASASLTMIDNVIVSIDPMDLGKLPLGTTYAGLGLPETAAVTVSTGAVHYLPVIWGAYTYDPTIAGTHTITGIVTLEDGFRLADGVENRAQITFELSEAMYGTADIVFLVDTTGSMWNEIQNVKNNIEQFASALEAAGVSVRWALLEYRDITCDGVDSTKIIYCGASEWYIDVTSYERALERLSVDGGGDREETVIDALKAATYLESRADAKTFYIVVTDADYKTNNSYGVRDMSAMINELVEKETVTSVVTKTEFYNIYRPLVDATHGILANIDGDFARELWRLTELIMEEVIYGDVTHIEIVTPPNKTEYFAGDYFDGSGMIVRAYYESGLSRNVTGYTVTPYSALQTTDSTIEINYRGKIALIDITVVAPEIPVQGITVSPDRLQLTVGGSATVTATVYPENASNKGVVWSTMNPNIAIVNNGVIYAIGLGETQITVTTLDGAYTATVAVTVSEQPVAVEEIYTSIGAVELQVNESVTVAVTVLPANASDKRVTWSSSNTNIAKVVNGRITGLSVGTATITVTTVDGELSARIYVKVVSNNVSNITGRVYEAGTSSLLSGVTVKLLKNGSLLQQTTTSSGSYSFANVAYGTYTITYEKSGFLTATRTYTVSATSAQLDNTYLVRNTSNAPGYVTGYVKDASTANPLSGIKVYVRQNAGNLTGTVLATVTTNSSGYYTTGALNPGNYTLQFVDISTSNPYLSTYINVAVTGNSTLSNQNVAMTKAVTSGFVVTLTWGQKPSDLDSHLKIDTPSTDYHVYYSQKSPSGAGAWLDVDDTTSYGPEHITVDSVKANTVYTYYVHNYSGDSSGTLQNSGAVVTLTIGNKCHTFNVPNGSGRYWNVFSYNSATGEITVNNRIVSSAP